MGIDRGDVNEHAKGMGIVLSSVALDRIAELELDYVKLLKKAKEGGEWFIGPEYIESLLARQSESPCRKSKADAERPPSCDMGSRLEILELSDVSNKSTCSGTVSDFIRYFNIRYENVRRVIKERIEYKDATSIALARQMGDRTKCRLIVMVTEKRESDRGKRFLEVEDPTGQLTVMVSDKSEDDSKTYERVLEDEVLGMEGVLLGDLFIAERLVQPDIPFNHERGFADEQVYAVFISDIHVGSNLFLEKEFQSFIDWLNGRGNKKDISGRVRYIFIAGDLVDGIGIYPDQDRELIIADIKKQYEFLALLLEQIPDHIQIVCCMGNHDAVRNAEPQPRVPQDIASRLYDIGNVHVTGNPVWVKAHGVKILIYHGTSLDNIIGSLSGCSYERPERGMVEYLIRRSLIPTYGVDGIAAEDFDYLFIGDIPDVLHCGHVHTNGFTVYKGVNVVNSGTWQAKTAFQAMLGHQPTPAIVPVMNLANHEMTYLNFNEDEKDDRGI